MVPLDVSQGSENIVRHTHTVRVRVAIIESEELLILWCDKMCDNDTMYYCVESYARRFE